MPLRVLRAGVLVALPLIAASALVVACDGTDVVVISDPVPGGRTSSSGGGGVPPGVGTSSGGSSGSYGTSSSGYYPGASSGTVPPEPPVAEDRLDVFNLQTVTVGHDVCGKPPGQCYDAQSFTIDFDAFTLAHTTCVQLGGSPDAGPSGGSTTDATTKRSLSKDEVATIQKALSAVRVSAAPHTGFDGPIDTIEVTNRNGTSSAYSPFAGCGQDKFQKVEEGFDVVWTTVRSL